MRGIPLSMAIASNIKSDLFPGELGCLQSAINIIKSNKDTKEHIHILDDDTIIFHKHHQLLEEILSIEDAKESPSWDILFTGLTVPLINEQLQFLINNYEKFEKNRQIRVFDMSNFIFVGTFSYIINKRSISKVIAILDQQDYTKPFDFLLREEICIKHSLRAICMFPFTATHSTAFYTTMGDRPFELTQAYQHLLQRPFYIKAHLPKLLEDIVQYAQSIGFEMPSTTANFRSLISTLWQMRDFISSSANVHGKYGE